jgi:hypothetical protein
MFTTSGPALTPKAGRKSTHDKTRPITAPWTNPERREIFTYCEGDTTLVRYSTDDDYRQALRDVIDWNKEAGYWLGIDPGFSETMKNHFVRLGFAEELH